KIKNYLMMLFLFAVGSVWAQTEVITGTVVDESGIPLPGANVVIQGTTTGALTDFDGNFSIQAARGDVLVISFLGFNPQEVVVGEANNIQITLTEDAATLDEVVVVGY